MNKKELAKRTAQRIGNLTEVELVSSINELENHTLFSGELLDAIHTQSEYERIGQALIRTLYVINEKDLILHWRVDSE